MWWRHQESGDAGSMKSLPTEGALSTERSKPKREAVWATDHRTTIELEVTKSTPAQIMLPSTLDADADLALV